MLKEKYWEVLFDGKVLEHIYNRRCLKEYQKNASRPIWSSTRSLPVKYTRKKFHINASTRFQQVFKKKKNMIATNMAETSDLSLLLKRRASCFKRASKCFQNRK